MTSGPGSAQDQFAWNERVRNQAMQGQYGKGGILREQMEANVLSEVAKRKLMTPKEQADIEMKKREHELRKKGQWNWKDEYGEGGGGPEIGGQKAEGGIGSTTAAGKPTTLPYKEGALPPPTTLPYTEGTRPAPTALGGEKLPMAPTPALRDVAPSMRVPPGTVQEGLGMQPGELNMMNMPQGGGMITVPEGGRAKPGYYWANAAGQMGHEARMEHGADYAAPPGGAPTETRMVPPVNYEPSLREAVPIPIARPGQTLEAIRPGPAGVENASLQTLARVLEKVLQGPPGKPDKTSLADVVKGMVKQAAPIAKTALKKEASLREWLLRQSPSRGGEDWLGKLIERLAPKGQPHDLLYR